MCFFGIRLDLLKHLDVGVHTIEIALEQDFVIHRSGKQKTVFRNELPAVALKITRVGVMALCSDVDNRGMRQGDHGFQLFNILGNKSLFLNDIIHHRLHLEQLLHIDGPVFYIVAVEVHEAEVAERNPTTVQYIILQGGIIIIGVAESHGALYFYGQPFVAFADKHIQHNERIIVLKNSLIHYLDFRVAKVVPCLCNLLWKLRR